MLPATSRLRLALLWVLGNDLRMTVLAVPPILPAIHHDLRLNETMVGALTALPVLVLAVASVPGSLLIARVGARRALVFGMVLVALAGAIRGVGPSTALLFAMSLLMGIGIAVSQPSLPTLARQWFPLQIGRATAVYSNGLLIGELIAASLTATVIVPLVGGSWELALVVWSVPVALTAVAIVLLTPHAAREPGAPVVKWWPDWRSARTWRLGLIFGCASISYFGSNAFIPDYLKATHQAGLVSVALTSLNMGQVPASFLVVALEQLLVGRRWPFLVTGVLMLGSLAGFYVDGVALVVGAAIMGFSSALVLVLCLALPPLLTGADDVHRLSAAMFTITYACAFAGSLTGGAVWDATGIPVTTFVPVALAGLMLALLALQLQGTLRSVQIPG